MDKKFIIAIDGFSSTGKSTIAKAIAQHLGYIYVDSGAMYRAVTLYAMQKGYLLDKFLNQEALVKSLTDIELQFKYNPNIGYGEIYLNDLNVEDKIRSIEVSNGVSFIAKIPEVRAKLVEQQKQMGQDRGIVMDGRDIGTVVFPDADLKIFMTSDPKIRAERRYEELKAAGRNNSYQEVLQNIEQRDYIDTTRADSPLVKAADAIEIDNSMLTKDELFDIVLALLPG